MTPPHSIVLRIALIGALTWPSLALAAEPAPPPGADALATASVTELVGGLKKCKTLKGCPPVQELLKRGKAVWPELQAGLEAPDEMTRFWTLGVLSEIPTLAAREPVAARLKDPKIRVRAAAAYALGAMHDKSVTPHLLVALADKDLNVRFAAAVAMGRVKDPKTIPALIGACRDRDEDVRAYAALALGDIGDPTALPTLHERLDQDAHARVRGFAAMALAKLADQRSLAPLLARLDEERDPKALAAAVFALGALGDPSAIAVLEALSLKLAAETDEALRDSKELKEYIADAIKTLQKPKTTAPPAPTKAP